MKTTIRPTDRLYAKYILRPLSMYPTKLFLQLGVSANQVTALSALAVFAGFVFLTYTSLTYWVIGWMFLSIYAILDHSDGEVARQTTGETGFGDGFDMLVHVLTDAFIFLPITLALYQIYGWIVFPLGMLAEGGMAMLHIFHFLKKRMDRKKSIKSIKELHVFKRFATTTNIILNSVLLVAILELFTGIGFRFIFLTVCGIGFPLVLIKKILWLKKIT